MQRSRSPHYSPGWQRSVCCVGVLGVAATVDAAVGQCAVPKLALAMTTGERTARRKQCLPDLYAERSGALVCCSRLPSQYCQRCSRSLSAAAAASNGGSCRHHVLTARTAVVLCLDNYSHYLSYRRAAGRLEETRATRGPCPNLTPWTRCRIFVARITVAYSGECRPSRRR